jgi:hypothetical protein
MTETRDTFPTTRAPTNIAEPIEIGKFFKNRKGDMIVVTIKQFENVVFADARQFVTDSDGISRPTKKGLAIALRHLPEFITLLGKALTKAHALGLIRNYDRAAP